MTREKIQLRPTGLWVLFGPILVCLWLAAVNYSNNLVYAVLYLIASLTFISAFYTWRNLSLLEIDHVRLQSGFAEGQIGLEIFLRNRAKLPVYGLVFARVEEQKESPLASPQGQVQSVAAGDGRTVQLTFPALLRGRYRVDALLVRTSYPFGLVTAGFRVPLAASYFVYPKPVGSTQLPELRSGGEDGLRFHPQAGDDFAGVRPYTAGESLRQVDWKAYARGRPLSVKQFRGGDAEELWLQGEQLSDLPLEAKLSQMALWVLTAEKENLAFGLKWGKEVLPPALGPAHARHALEFLAEARRPA